jgi:hypothetical protein
MPAALGLEIRILANAGDKKWDILVITGYGLY